MHPKKIKSELIMKHEKKKINYVPLKINFLEVKNFEGIICASRIQYDPEEW